jgi:hypothetical protein
MVLVFGLLGCSNNSNTYNYIKILSIAKADTVTDLNKGLKLYNYLYYNPEKDSVFFRFVQSVDPDTFNTYQGSFRNKEYADTIALLIELLRQHDDGYLPYKGNMDAGYSGPHLYVEYFDSKGVHYNAFAVDNDTLSNFSKFFHRLENLPWEKVLINNQKVDETEEVVKILKGLGTYDSMVKPYVPLQCAPGIELDKLYGTWRTIGDKYNDATFKYWVYKIDSSGEWVINRIDSSKTSQYYNGKIKSIKNQIIKIESERALTILEVLNLTDNCFEFRHKASKQIWRLDRMK